MNLPIFQSSNLPIFQSSNLPIFLLLVFLAFGCSKDDSKSVQKGTIVPESQLLDRENQPYLVPKVLAVAIAKRLDITNNSLIANVNIAERAIDTVYTIPDSLSYPALYIVNFQSGSSAVLSSDFRDEPILAILETQIHLNDTVPSAIAQWFIEEVKFVNQIRYSGLGFSETRVNEWVRLIDVAEIDEIPGIEDCCQTCPNFPQCLVLPNLGCGANLYCDPCEPTSKIVGPLTTTTWGQGCRYNNLCPDLNCVTCSGDNESALTGCVATAMAQVIKFWAIPSSQGYNYALMPNVAQNGSVQIQRLMLDAGLSVNMSYGCQGSGAFSKHIDNALKGTFSFGSASRANWNSDTAMKNLDDGQPLILDASSDIGNYVFFKVALGGHAWVCDGYRLSQSPCGSTLLLRMNWGWERRFDGWYNSHTWNPSSFNYQYGRKMTFDIKP
jgi:Peptidase C10 family